MVGEGHTFDVQDDDLALDRVGVDGAAVLALVQRMNIAHLQVPLLHVPTAKRFDSVSTPQFWSQLRTGSQTFGLRLGLRLGLGGLVSLNVSAPPLL